MKRLQLICLTSIIAVVSMMGCQGTKGTSCREYGPDDFDFYKRIEGEVIPGGIEGMSETDRAKISIPPVPDYFNYGNACKAYDAGRKFAGPEPAPAFATRKRIAEMFGPLSIYPEISLQDMAFWDGDMEQIVQDVDAVMIRNRERKRRQREYWGRYATDKYEQDDFLCRGKIVTTNCYAHLWAAYACGYSNGYIVVSTKKTSPIATGYYLQGKPSFGANPFRRAYVYGWFSACFDYFTSNPEPRENGILHGPPADLFYARRVSLYRRYEIESLLFCSDEKFREKR